MMLVTEDGRPLKPWLCVQIKCKLVCWHPDIATQMCLASEDDHTPVIQLWDLRFATSPLKSLEGHQR